MAPKRVIFDSHHPKHFLILREVAKRLISEGVEIHWTCRRKDVLVDLIRAHFENVHVLTSAGSGLMGLAKELVAYDWRLWSLTRKLKPSLLAGNSVSVAHVGKVSGIPSIVFNDDDAKANRQYPLLAYPFSTLIMTPDCLDEDYGARHVKYPSYHELAYLHPDLFYPADDIRELLGIDPGTPYSIVRFVSLQASHDFHEEGLSLAQKRELIERLETRGRVFVSIEGKVDEAFRQYVIGIPPERMHDALAHAQVYLGDSQTMAAEAAVLGTPSLRCNTFVGRLAYLEELEHRFELTFGFLPENFDALVSRLNDILATPDIKPEWSKRRSRMLDEKINPTDVYHQHIHRFLS